MLNYSLRDYDGIKVIELAGNLTVNSAGIFNAFVQKLLEKESVMVNLEKVKLVTSSGLSTLIDVSFFAKKNGHRLILLWPSEELINFAETLDVYSHLIFADSLDEGKTKIAFFT